MGLGRGQQGLPGCLSSACPFNRWQAGKGKQFRNRRHHKTVTVHASWALTPDTVLGAFQEPCLSVIQKPQFFFEETKAEKDLAISQGHVVRERSGTQTQAR